MANRPYIYIKAATDLKVVVESVRSLLKPDRVSDDIDGYYYITFSWYRLVCSYNEFPRRDAPPEDWYPPFDSYPIQIRLDAFTNPERAKDEARKIFDLLKVGQVWILALTDDQNGVLDRYYPPTPEGEAARRIDEDEASIVLLPKHDRNIFVSSTATLDDLAVELSAALGSPWTKSSVVDNLTKTMSHYYSFTMANCSLSVNEKYSVKFASALNPEASSTYRYKLSVRDYQGQVVQLENARRIFTALKGTGRWSIALVEDETKLLEAFNSETA